MQEHTGAERKGKDLLGMPVVTIADGRKRAKVMALLVRRGEATVAAVRICTSLSPGQVVPIGNLGLVGMDVILVDSAAALEPALPTMAVGELDDALTWRAVISASGERVRSVSGFWVNTTDGRITAYRVRPEAGFLSRLTNLLRRDTFEVISEQVQALGTAALIVMDSAIPNAAPTESHQPAFRHLNESISRRNTSHHNGNSLTDNLTQFPPLPQ